MLHISLGWRDGRWGSRVGWGGIQLLSSQMKHFDLVIYTDNIFLHKLLTAADEGPLLTGCCSYVILMNITWWGPIKLQSISSKITFLSRWYGYLSANVIDYTPFSSAALFSTWDQN